MLAMSNEKGTARPKVYDLFMVPPPVPGDGTAPQGNMSRHDFSYGKRLL
jgi:hypothetical protein